VSQGNNMASIRLSNKEKLALLSNIGTMLKAGIPILEAVDTLRIESRGGNQKLLSLFHKALNDGMPLSQAMAQAPEVFDPVSVNLIKTAEQAGNLEQALNHLAETTKKDIAFRDAIRTSMLYPAFVFVIFIGVLTVILTFVIPRISKVFSGLKTPLPAPTQFLIAASDFVLGYYLYIIAVAVLLVVIVVIFYKLKRRVIVNAVLNLPLFTILGREIDLARLSGSMAQLLKAGVPVAEALELSLGVVNKNEIREAIRHMSRAVDAGKPLTSGLSHSKKIIPSMTMRILETAERSGTLPEAMGDTAEYFENQVTKSLKTITALIEPVMIVVIGLLVGAMMLAIVGPIYNIITQIRAR
jgi:type IV pilus assembly protein PilC